jgi:hypothetical protein
LKGIVPIKTVSKLGLRTHSSVRMISVFMFMFLMFMFIIFKIMKFMVFMMFMSNRTRRKLFDEKKTGYNNSRDTVPLSTKGAYMML